MTTQTQVRCPECGYDFPLLAGKLPEHSSQGLPCPMGKRAPIEWPLGHKPGLGEAGHIPAETPPATPPDKKQHRPGVELCPAPRQCKPRSDKRKTRTTGRAPKAPSAEGEASTKGSLGGITQNMSTGGAVGLGTAASAESKPKAKRSPRRSYFVVVGSVEPFATLDAALAAVGAAEGRHLICGRMLKTRTVSIPASTVTKLVR